MLRRLKIDPEFQSKIPPLTFEELNLLETNILEEGRILSPLIVWNGLIVDGHNRFAILKNHPGKIIPKSSTPCWKKSSPTAMKRLSGFAKTSLAGEI